MAKADDTFEVVIFNDDTAMLADDLESVDARYIESHDGVYSRRTYTRAQCEDLEIDISSVV